MLPQKFNYKRWQFWLSMLAWNPKDTWVRINQVWNHANGRVYGDWYQFVLREEDRSPRKRHKRWTQFLIGGHSMIAIGFVLSGHPFLVVVFTFGTFYCLLFIVYCLLSLAWFSLRGSAALWFEFGRI